MFLTRSCGICYNGRMEIQTLPPIVNLRVIQRVPDILERYAQGETLSELLTEAEIPMKNFLAIVSVSPVLLSIYEESIMMHKEAIRIQLHDVVETSALVKKNVEDSKWLLEKLYPEYAKKSMNMNTNVNVDPTEAIDLSRYKNVTNGN